MVPRAATDEEIISCRCVFHRVERLSLGRFASCQLSAFLKTSSWLSGQQRSSNISTKPFSWGLLLEQPMSIFPFALFLLATHILSLDWNENVVPRLLAIFRSVERKADGWKHTRNIEMRQQEFARRPAPLIERYLPFLDSGTLKRAPQVQKRVL